MYTYIIFYILLYDILLFVSLKYVQFFCRTFFLYIISITYFIYFSVQIAKSYNMYAWAFSTYICLVLSLLVVHQLVAVKSIYCLFLHHFVELIQLYHLIDNVYIINENDATRTFFYIHNALHRWANPRGVLRGHVTSNPFFLLDKLGLISFEI